MRGVTFQIVAPVPLGTLPLSPTGRDSYRKVPLGTAFYWHLFSFPLTLAGIDIYSRCHLAPRIKGCHSGGLYRPRWHLSPVTSLGEKKGSPDKEGKEP